MGLRTVRGNKRAANYETNRQEGVRHPLVMIYRGGRAQLTVRCGDLVSVTGVTDPKVLQAVHEFAQNLREDEPWTKEQVYALLQKVGRRPFPSLLSVEHLEGQGTLLLRVVDVKGPGVTELSYPKRSNRPVFNVLPAVKDEGIEVPVGMCLEVPVALVVDEGFLKVEAWLNKGVQRAVKQKDDEETEGEEDGE